MKRINIITWHNGGGLSRDVDILVSALPKERFAVTLNGLPVHEATVYRRRIYHRMANVRDRVMHGGKMAKTPFDLSIFLEDMVPGFFRHARVNTFIPNPEWFKKNQHRYLQDVDLILCKTRSAQQTFSSMGGHCKFISFTSEDRLSTTRSPTRENGFLHLAGRSWQKGTKALTDLWQQHPEWPTLRVVQSAKTYRQSTVKPIDAPNIDHILERVDDTRLRTLQNTHLIHLCPSEAEGFGHCIAEAMSCRALTLTTNGPPMNELIAPDRGVLVNYHRASPQRSGANYFVDPADLEEKITRILGMDQDAISTLGNNARAWYENNDRFFRQQIVETLDDLLSVA